MTGALKPYPAYRDSGLPWLGRVPKHWEVRRLSQMGRLSKGNGGSKEDETPVGIPCVRYGDLYTTHSYFIERTRSFISKDTSKNYTPIAFGDVLFAASGETIDEIGKSAVNLMRTAACCGGDVILFRPEGDTVASYMGYALDCRSSAAQKAAMGRGITVMHIYAGQLKRLLVPLPPIPEQAAIARYLDHVGARVDRYIGAKERLIALLKERKQATIDRAVTRGLDPNAPMKPTSIAWIPEVPAHWEVRALKHWVKGRAEMLEEQTDPGYEFDYLDIGCVGTGFLVSSPERVRFRNAPSRARQIVKVGDTVISTVRTYLKAIYFVEDDWPALIASTGFAVLRPRDMHPGLFGYLLQSSSFINQVSANSIGASYPAIPETHLRALPVAAPVDREEQIKTFEFVRKGTSNVDSAIENVRQGISYIREYRERLINDVVTGKLDVREAQVDAAPEVDARREADRAP